MNYVALRKAVLHVLAILSVIGLAFAVMVKYPLVILGTIIVLMFLGAFAILLVAYYDKYNK